MATKNKRPKLIAPSILSADFAYLATEIKAIAEAGADWVHVDVMDGHFVPNITIGPFVVKALKAVTTLPLDVHLMIDDPEKYVESFAIAGADYLTFHIESTKNPQALIKKIRSLGVKVGITLRPKSKLNTILPFLDRVDLVLVMSVEPGFGGQSFMPEQMEKVSQLRGRISESKLNCLIEIDGGINAETIKECSEVDVIVAGSAVFIKDSSQLSYVQKVHTYRKQIDLLKK